MKVGAARPLALRFPCTACGAKEGYVQERNKQDTVRCAACDKFQYNAPRTETGREERSTATVHNGIRPKQRARILLRAGGRCELCNVHEDVAVLHAGHMISVNDGLAAGWTEAQMNSDDNLGAFCDQCNLGLGAESVPVRFAMLLWARRNIAKKTPA